MVVWLTGLPSSGKTTIAHAVKSRLVAQGFRTEILDGDVFRTELCRDLGFSRADRLENLRRLTVVANLLSRNGVVVLVAAIAPYRDVRDNIRRSCPTYLEVYVNAPLDVCEARDVKGLYRKARSGQVANVTGIDDVYERPLSPEVECRTDRETVEESVAKVVAAVTMRQSL